MKRLFFILTRFLRPVIFLSGTTFYFILATAVHAQYPIRNYISLQDNTTHVYGASGGFLIKQLLPNGSGTRFTSFAAYRDSSIFYVAGNEKFRMSSTAVTASDDILPGASASYDVGATGTRWRDLWLSRNVTIGSIAGTSGQLSLKGNMHIEASGNSNQLRMLHDGTHSYINSTDGNINLQFGGSSRVLMSPGGSYTFTGSLLYVNGNTDATAEQRINSGSTTAQNSILTFQDRGTTHFSWQKQSGNNFLLFDHINNATRLNFTAGANSTVTYRALGTGIHEWYAGGFLRMTLDGSGNLTVIGDAAINGGDITTTATNLRLQAGGGGVLRFLGDATTSEILAENNHSRWGNRRDDGTQENIDIGAYTNSTTWNSRLLLTASGGTFAGDLAVNGGDLTTNAATFNLLNSTVQTLNLGGASTATTIGATTGSTTVRNNTYIGDAKNFGSFSFTSGFTGAGWQSYYKDAEYWFETDNINIRGTLSAYELLIQQIRATNGSIYVSSVQKVDTVIDATAGAEIVDMEDPGNNNVAYFAEGDIVLTQQVRVDDPTAFIKRIVRVVDATSGKRVWFTTATGGPADTDVIEDGDEFLRIGSETNAARRGSVYLTADDTEAPYIDVVDGVASWADFRSIAKNKVRLGKLTGVTDADFGGALSGYGLYTTQGYFKGNIHVKSGVSQALQNDAIQIGNITGTANNAIKLAQTGTPSSSGIFAYTGAGNESFALRLDNTAKIASAYFSDTDIWAGNIALNNAATEFVLGDLGSANPKLALGATADAITIAGTEPGVMMDGGGQFKAYTDANNYIRKTASALEVKASQFLLASSDLSSGGYQWYLTTNMNAYSRPGFYIGWGTSPSAGSNSITVGAAAFLHSSNGQFTKTASGWDNKGGIAINVNSKNIFFAGEYNGVIGAAIAGWSFDETKFTKGSSSTGFALNTSNTAFLSSGGLGFEVWDASSPKFVVGDKDDLRMSWNTDVASGLYLGGNSAGWKVTATGLENTSSSSTIVAGTDPNVVGISAPAASTDVVFWAGDDYANRTTAPLRIYADGLIYSENSPYDLANTAELYDDFIIPSVNTTDPISILNWQPFGLNNVITGFADGRPGSVILVSNSSSPGGIYTATFRASFEATYWFSVVTVGATSANWRGAVGLASATNTWEPAHGIYFKNDGGNWIAVTRSSSTSTTTDTGSGQSTSYRQFRIIRKASSVEFYIDGVLKATHITNIPSSVNMYALCGIRSNDASGHSIAIDYFQMRMTGLDR